MSVFRPEPLPPRSDEPVPWGWLAGLTALAVALRLIGINDGMWWDEIRTLVDSARFPVSQIVTVFPGDNQHTFFSLLAHLSIAAFGDHVWSLRLPAVIAGVATVPLLYVFAREFVGRSEALLAAALLSVAYHHVWYSQSARGYSTLAFLAVLGSWLIVRGLRTQRLQYFLAYAVVAALGAYTHLSMIMLVASHALLCILPLGWPGIERERLLRWRWPVLGFTLAAALTLVLYAPMLRVVREVVSAEPQAEATPRWALAELLRGLGIGFGNSLAVLVVGFLFAAGLWSTYQRSRYLVGLLVLPAVLTGAVTILLHRPIRPRFVFFLIGFGLIVIVEGALEVGRRLARSSRGTGGLTATPGVALSVAVAIASASAVLWQSRYPKQDFVGAMRFIQSGRAADEPVLTIAGARMPYRAYYRLPWEEVTTLDGFHAARARGHRVWVVFAFKSFIDRDLAASLDAECPVARVFPGTLGGGEVTVCTASPRK